MPKRYLTGGGKDLKNRYKSGCYLSEIFKNPKHLAKQFSKFLTPRCEDKLLGRRGSILIEFAVCMPVLIILLFYINDLVLYKRYQSQAEFAAQCAANIIQNITQKRTSKLLTKQDFQNICTLVTQKCQPFSQYLALVFIKGTGANKCIPSWVQYVYTPSNSVKCNSSYFWTRKSPNDIGNFIDLSMSKDNRGKSFVCGTEYNSTDIAPDLQIQNGEYKVVLEKYYYTGGFSDNCYKLGFKMLKTRGFNQKNYLAFLGRVIFSPKPGIFDPDNPSL